MSARRTPTISIPVVDIWEYLFERKTKPFPDHQVIYTCSETDRHYTYADVERTARQFGAGLATRWSWKKGDVLALFILNSIDTPAITWGCHWAGGIVSPANPNYTSAELSHHLKDSGAKALVTQKHCLANAVRAAEAVQLPMSRIILIESERGEDGKFTNFASLLDSSNFHLPRVTIKPKVDLAFLVYSSGTTAHPKGVMLSHSNIVSDLAMINSVDGDMLEPNHDKLLAVLPYYHIYGLMFLVHLPIYTGVESVVMPRFDIKSFCSIIQSHRITYTYVAPPILLHLAKNPIVGSYDLSTLRMITSGAAPLSNKLIMTVFDRLKVPTKQAYGLSETSPATHVQAWNSWKTKMGSVGQALPNLIVKIADPDGQSLPPGENGEVWIKGPTVFQGYHNNAEATLEAITSDGYFKTGDIGFEDMDRNLFITDRIKELIKYKGSQVAPAELEGHLAVHPKVQDVAVIGFFIDEIASEVPLAYIVSAEGVEENEYNAKDIVAWLTSRVAKHKYLRGGVVWIDEIPKSASGKILRRKLKIDSSRRVERMGAVQFPTSHEKPVL